MARQSKLMTAIQNYLGQKRIKMFNKPSKPVEEKKEVKNSDEITDELMRLWGNK